MKTSALQRRLKSKRTRERFIATQQRRTRLASEFRARLQAALSATPGDVAQEALVCVAVSAFVEVTEVSSQFTLNRAKPYAVKNLSIARGQLQRSLRALGLIERSDSDDEPVPSVQDLISRFEKPASANGGAA